MNYFFTGCTHFDHARIIEYTSRPFDSVEHMNEAMIENWNRVVGPYDHVFHLGDFSFASSIDRNRHILGRLNGVKTLVMGNHDHYSWRTIPNSGWAEVVTYLRVKIFGGNVVMFHYPMESWHGSGKGDISLHCHTHSNHVKGHNRVQNRVNVSVEAWNYTPVSIDEIWAVWADAEEVIVPLPPMGGAA